MAPCSDNAPDSFNLQLFSAALFELSLGLVAVFLGNWLSPHPHATMPRLHEWGRIVIGLGVGSLVGGAMLVIILGLDRLDYAWIKTLSKTNEETFEQWFRGISLSGVIAISLAAGLGEELLFRGWLQSWLTMQLSFLGNAGSWIAIVVSSVLFGLAHPISKGYVVIGAGLGMILGTSYFLTENILVPIVAHAVYDAVLLLRLLSKSKAIEDQRCT